MNTYASQTYSSWNPFVISTQDDIAINWFWLQNEFIRTFSREENKKIDLVSFQNPVSDWSWFLWNYKRWNIIPLSIRIKWDNVSDFQERLDNVRKEIFIENSILDMKINWEIRRCVVNCTSSPKIEKHYNITFITLNIIFESLEPNFYAINRESRAYLNKTASFNEEITNNWWDISFPIFYFQFKTWLSSVESVEVEMWENTITIEETISDNDIIIVNWETKSITLNWSEIDYLWEIPFLWLSQNIVLFTISWTFEVDINVLNKIYYV